VDAGGSAVLQCSQVGRSSSIGFPAGSRAGSGRTYSRGGLLEPLALSVAQRSRGDADRRRCAAPVPRLSNGPGRPASCLVGAFPPPCRYSAQWLPRSLPHAWCTSPTGSP